MRRNTHSDRCTDSNDDNSAGRAPSRRQLLRASVGLAAGIALAGCSGTEGLRTDDGTSATDQSPGTDGATLPQSAVESLSLRKVAEGGIEVGEDSGTLVAYQRQRDEHTAVEGFATAVADGSKPDGRSIPASALGLDEVTVECLRETPTVAADRVGTFLPAGARRTPTDAPQVQAAEVLGMVPGAELPAEVTIDCENAALVEGPDWIPPDLWVPGAMWGPGNRWVSESDWVPGKTWVAGTKWPPEEDPTAARVVVAGGDRSLGELGIVEDLFTESLEVGEQLATENTLFASPWSTWQPEGEWGPASVYDAGTPAEMGGADAAVALLSSPDGFENMEIPDLLTSEAGIQALVLAGATNSPADGDAIENAEWSVDPVRLDGTDHFQPDPGAYSGTLLGSKPDIMTYGGVMASAYGPYAVVVHGARFEGEESSGVAFGVDGTPIGSSDPVMQDKLGAAHFPAPRLHNSRAFLWVAGGGSIQIQQSTGTPTATGTETSTGTSTSTE